MRIKHCRGLLSPPRKFTEIIFAFFAFHASGGPLVTASTLRDPGHVSAAFFLGPTQNNQPTKN
jgi:hypothetical protein